MAVLKEEIVGLSAIMAVGGGLLIALGLSSGKTSGQPGGGGGGGPGGGSDEFGLLNSINPGEVLGQPVLPGFSAGQVPLQIGQFLVLQGTQDTYAGPGRDAYSYARVVQNIDGQWVTVYGSGVAGTHLGPSIDSQVYPLVPPSQPQPPGVPLGSLALYVWPGTEPGPISGAPPQLGIPGTLLLEIYQRKDPQDADGYSSPTYNGRIPVRRTAYRNVILFT